MGADGWLWWAAGVAACGLALLVASSFVFAVSTYTAWAATRDADLPDPDDDGFGLGGAAGLSALILRETSRIVVMLLLYPVGLVVPPPVLKARGRRPVLLVHCYTMNWSNFAFLWLRLKAAGHGPVLFANLPRMFGPMDGLVGGLGRRIDAVLASTGASELDVVAHSMGGLVTRRLMGDDDAAGRRRVRRLVTLATPHHGTRAAHLAFGPNGASMRPGSSFLRSLPVPGPDRVVAISSRADNVVLPAEHARIGAPGRDLVLDGLGHFGLLTSRRVAALVTAALTDGQPALAEGASDVRAEA